MLKSHEDLFAWKMSYELTKSIYKLTKTFPKDERYCFVDQMRRAALSIPSNISEGYYRYSKNEYRHFCYIAYGSANELHTQIKLARDLNFSSAENFLETENLLIQTLKLLNALCRSLH